MFEARIPAGFTWNVVSRSIEWYVQKRRMEAERRRADAKIHEQAALLDKDAATKRGIVVSHTSPGDSVAATVELCVALILGGAALTGRNFIRKLMGAQMELPGAVWNRLNWSWTAFFAVMGCINLYVAGNYSTETWVNFKLFGGMGLMLVFVILQAMYMARYIEDKESPGEQK